MPGESWRDGKQSGVEAAREKRRRKRSRRGREGSGDRLRKSGTLYNPNRSIYPAMMRHHSHSPSPFNSSVESGSPLPPSPPDSDWEYHCSQVSPLTSSVSSPSRCSSSSSPVCSSPQPSSQTPPTPTLYPGNRSGTHHGEKPGGKRKYKSRHLDSDDKDPTWRPVSSHRREKRRERREKERRKRGRRQRQRRDAGNSSSRRCREDRSPSVEIIYEGTITSTTTQPSARKRRRKRPRRTQHSSSPVIITLDSDSSHDDVNNKNNNRSSSSSPLSSQKTVDFSDLPPLPLVHSAGVGETLNAEIGELPVDILDRGSGSETEPAGPSAAAGPIAIDNSDNSDRDVDVENVEESSSLLGLDDDKGPADTKANSAACQRQSGTVDGGSRSTEMNDAAPTTTDLVHKTDSEVCTSERRLLATILNDLRGITAPKCDLSLNFEPNCSSNTRKSFQDHSEVGPAHSNQDDWLTETRHQNTNFPEFNDIGEQNRGFNLPTCRASIPPLPPLKEGSIGEEVKEVPPLLKQASPIRPYNRNTPPPLKHKDTGSPHHSPISPTHLHSTHASVDADSAGSEKGGVPSPGRGGVPGPSGGVQVSQGFVHE
ncbi:hypothetical protein L3Q82_016447 [Scortum barcoo]|uniref:Uncharacterized protein n=1 Tax=Scortum barcoo TaxID=214431 RepID=A0ACB8XA89_9TELE|nr:hypothetical protein L3Q82_016447 [Scortum barcoo]